MDKNDLITLSGQVINVMLSADSSMLTKLVDRTLHRQIADAAVNIAYEMLQKINNEFR